jgi:hypothetical protein
MASVVLIIAAVAIVLAGTGVAVYYFDHHKPDPHTLTSGPPPIRPYLGVFVPGVTKSYQPVTRFANATHTTPNIVLEYSQWGSVFPLQFATRAEQHGALPFIQIMPRHIYYPDITKGRYDKYLTQYAEEVKFYGNRVMLSLAPEMNGWWYQWGWTHTTPSAWIAGWRHVVTLFRHVGATNVSWVWTVNRGVPGRSPDVSYYWPGAKYVTWVGIDGYYFNRGDNFRLIFGETLQQVKRIAPHTPVLLSEAAIGPRAGRVISIPNLFLGIHNNHLLGLVWFDVAQHAGIFHQDWTLEGHPAAEAAFQQGVKVMMSK